MTVINTVDCQWYVVWLVRYKQTLWHISVSSDFCDFHHVTLYCYWSRISRQVCFKVSLFSYDFLVWMTISPFYF